MADIQKLNVNNTTYDISTTWAKVTGKPATFTPSSHTHSYLPLSGGTIEANNASPLTIKVSTYSNLLTFIAPDDTNNYIERTVIGYYSSSTRGSEFRNATSGSYIGITDNGTPHYNGNTLLHSGNYNSYAPTLTGTGASSTWGISISGSAAKVGGYSITTNRNTPWGTIPYISKFGAMDVGKSFEFHFDNTTGSDYSTVLVCTGNYGNIVKLPSADGTLALLTDNVASATKLQTPRTIWGQSFDGTGNVDGGITIRRTWSVGSYTEGIRVVGASNEWCGVFLGTADTTSGYQDSQWNIVKTDIDTLRINRGPSYLSFLEIKPNGNVLIGTTTDNGYKLQVNGSTLIDRGDNGGVLIGRNGNTIDGYVNGSLADLHLNYASAYNISLCRGGGNVSIGTTANSGYKLQVNGSANATTLYENGTRVALSGHTHTKSQITDFPSSLPASDVYAWAKASSKPTYTYSEVGAAAASHSHSIIVTEGDKRNVATKPNDYINRFVFRGLKTNSTIGSPSSATYSYLIGLRGWSDSSGGDAHELAFNNSGIFRRQGSTTEWGSWYKLIDTGNFTKSLIEGVLTGNITSHTHDDRYYTESEINTKLSGKSDTGHTHSYLPLSGGNLTGLLKITTNGITATYGAGNSSFVHFTNSAGASYYFDNSIYVNGAIKVYNKSWGVTKDGRFDGSGFYQSSDELLKTFYDPIKPDLEKLRKLRKNYFKFNDKDKLEIGVSAQEIQNLYPEIVSTDDNGYLSVAYDKLSVIALAAIDELDDKISQLANKISTLENIVNKLMGEKGVN